MSEFTQLEPLVTICMCCGSQLSPTKGEQVERLKTAYEEYKKRLEAAVAVAAAEGRQG